MIVSRKLLTKIYISLLIRALKTNVTGVPLHLYTKLTCTYMYMYTW